jgi:RNA polymerase sigma-70 factor (ECF subfamily)
LSVNSAILGAAGPVGAELTVAGIFRDYAPFAWRILRRLGVSEADVDDICQEVFITVHRRLPDFEGRSSVQTWLYGICVRTAADYRKRARTRREIVGAPAPNLGEREHQEYTLALREARATLDRILEELVDERRAVFVLYEIEELPMTEVATAVGCPLQTAYSRLHAARNQVEAAVRRLRAKGPAR